MTLATQKDIEGHLKTSLYFYKSHYESLDIEESLNFLTQLIYVITESPVMNYYNFTSEEINGELTPFLDSFYFDYCNEKFGDQTNEFKFWKLFFFNTITGGTEYRGVNYAYTKECLLSIINEKPGELIPYFPFNAFLFDGVLTTEEEKVVSKKIAALIAWLKTQPKTQRIKTINGFMDYSGPLITPKYTF